VLELGRINPRPNPRIVRETPSTATFDGDNGLGLVVGPKANALAMEKAAAVGSGWVSVRNSNHFGIAGYYPLQALQRDLIGWAMTNSTKHVMRTHGFFEKLLRVAGVSDHPNCGMGILRKRAERDQPTCLGLVFGVTVLDVPHDRRRKNSPCAVHEKSQFSPIQFGHMIRWYFFVARIP